jgi:hypothetical protein
MLKIFPPQGSFIGFLWLGFFIWGKGRGGGSTIFHAYSTETHLFDDFPVLAQFLDSTGERHSILSSGFWGRGHAGQINT